MVVSGETQPRGYIYPSEGYSILNTRYPRGRDLEFGTFSVPCASCVLYATCSRQPSWSSELILPDALGSSPSSERSYVWSLNVITE